MAINIYHEARSEPIAGQVAVAYVTLHRSKQQQKPICDVVFQHKQFSWTNGSTIPVQLGNLPPLHILDLGWTFKYLPRDYKSWSLATTIATKVLAGRTKDNTQGSTYYHTKAVNPYWNKSLQLVAIHGAHMFYKTKNKKARPVYASM